MKPSQTENCPVAVVLRLLSGKWKPMILHHLNQGTLRFSQLRRLLPAATPQMLTVHLRELQQDGLIHRVIYAEIPPKVEYSLTETGRSLRPVVGSMAQWGAAYARNLPARPESA